VLLSAPVERELPAVPLRVLRLTAVCPQLRSGVVRCCWPRLAATGLRLELPDEATGMKLRSEYPSRGTRGRDEQQHEQEAGHRNPESSTLNAKATLLLRACSAREFSRCMSPAAHLHSAEAACYSNFGCRSFSRQV
jgi:hypothetical protein